MARGRHAHAPHESEKRRQSASLEQAVDVAAALFDADDAGGGTGAAMLSAGTGAEAATGAALWIAVGAGATSLRLHDMVAATVIVAEHAPAISATRSIKR